MLFMSVVFPAPFGPRSPKKRPASTSSEMPSSARTPVEYVFLSFSTLRAGTSFITVPLYRRGRPDRPER